MIHRIIELFEKEYILYENGNLFDIEKGEYKNTHMTSRGYFEYCFGYNGEVKFVSVHRLVAETFIPNLDNKPCVDHINTVKTDNRIQNLRWCTQQENMLNPITYERINEAKKKPIAGMDENGNEVCRFNSVNDAVAAGYSRHCGCVANGKRIRSNKLYWRWL